MRIYGGHDYYDCGMALGRDSSVTLVREKSRSIPVEAAGGSLLARRVRLRIPHTSSQVLFLRNVAVVFCTKVYRGVLVQSGLEKEEGVWSAAKLRAWIEQQSRVQRSKNIRADIELNWRERHDRLQPTLEDYFAPFDAPLSLYNYMLMNKASILVQEQPRAGDWVGEMEYFRVNPACLKQLGFAKALDPYTAFQELSMWIGGVLGGTSPEIVKITDDRTLIEGHGFDNRFSFRGPRIA